MALNSVVLHLGAHKTATSLIQKFMRDNPKLCRDAGIVAPRRSETDRYIRWGRRADIAAGGGELRERIAEADRGDAEHFVISHENAIGRPLTSRGGRLYPDARTRATEVRGALGDLPLTVVYYVRQAADFVESYYLQSIQEGGTAEFAEWFSQYHGPSLSWDPVYEDLCAVFGAEAVHIRSFDEEIKKGQAGFLEGFFSIFAPDKDEQLGNFEYEPVQNSSISERGLELALVINPLIDTSAERKLVRKFLQENFSNQDQTRPKLFSARKKEKIGLKYEHDIDDVLARSARATTAG